MDKNEVQEIIIGNSGDAKDIPAALKKVRVSKGLTQDDLFVRTGISQNALSMYEGYKRQINNKKIERIIDGLDAELRIRFNKDGELDYMDNNTNKLESSKEISYQDLFKSVATNDNSIAPEHRLSSSLKKEKELLEFIKNADKSAFRKINGTDEYGKVYNKVTLGEKYNINLNSIYRNIEGFKEDFFEREALLRKKLELEHMKEFKLTSANSLYKSMRIYGPAKDSSYNILTENEINNLNTLVSEKLPSDANFKNYKNIVEYFDHIIKFINTEISLDEKEIENLFKVNTKEYRPFDLSIDFSFNWKSYKVYTFKFTFEFYFYNRPIGFSRDITFDSSILKRGFCIECVKSLTKYMQNIFDLNSCKAKYNDIEVQIDMIEKSIDMLKKIEQELLLVKEEIRTLDLHDMENYILGLYTDTVDIDFWYNDGGDMDDALEGGTIGMDIRFLDNLDEYYHTEIIFENLYSRESFEDITYNYLLQRGLEELNKALNP